MLILSLITAVSIYWYPSYETYKVISARRSGTEADVEKWLIYWCVVGALAAFETSLEWLVDWVVFYYEIKALLLLFIARGGAEIIYHEFLSRQYAQHEAGIDREIEEFKSRAFAYVQERLQTLYEVVVRVVAATQKGQGQGENDRAPQSGSKPSYGEVASQLWNTYGSAVLATGTKILNGGAATTSSPHPSTGVDPNGPIPEPADGGRTATPTHIPLPNSPYGNGKNRGRSPPSPY